MIARKILCLTIVLGVIVGCATARMDKLDATLRAYERAIRWSEFQNAFAIANSQDAPVPDFRRLQNVRVTSYDKIGSPLPNKDGTRIAQAVEIRYVHVDNMSERSLTDQQLWVYVEKDERWRLISPFPAFR